MITQPEMSPETIENNKLYRAMGLSDEEYQRVKKILGRRPNMTETGLFAVMWSEHCSYKSSKPVLKKFPTSGPGVIQGPGEGAGVVDIGDGQAIVFKMESHNSPSAVEPFEGSATGVGGIVRDVFSMGAKPIALMNSLRFGELTTEPTAYLVREVARGMAHYGNTLEVPTVGGEVYFDDIYHENPLVNAMCVGLIHRKDLQKGTASGVGNSVIYAGRATGRDGIHGATFSSEVVEGETDKQRSAIAVGDPYIEKRLIDACLEVIQSDALVGMQDMGAAGLTSSASEMASSAGTGIEMNLNLVPRRDPDMTAYELMLSESQERMLLVVERGREQEVIDTFKQHQVEAATIGEVIEEKTFRIKQHGEIFAEVPIDALVEEAPVYHLPQTEARYYQAFQKEDKTVPLVENHGEMLKTLLAQPTIASKQAIYSQFDTEAQGHTVFGPGSSAGVVAIEGTNKAIAITTDCNARYIYLDPEVGGKIAVAEAARNLICTGARPLALTDGLNFGHPTDPEVFWQIEKSTDGISAACDALNTPVISGNVSLYNQSQGQAIFPTPIIGMVGLLDSVDQLTPSHFQRAGDEVYIIGATEAAFGGSELQRVVDGKYSGQAPRINLTVEAKRQQQLLKAIEEGLITSATDVSEGGLAIALAESTFSNKKLGVNVSLAGERTVQLFSEMQSRFLISVRPAFKEKLQSIIESAEQIGHVTEAQELVIHVNGEKVIDEQVEELERIWENALPCLLKSEDK